MLLTFQMRKTGTQKIKDLPKTPEGVPRRTGVCAQAGNCGPCDGVFLYWLKSAEPTVSDRVCPQISVIGLINL